MPNKTTSLDDVVEGVNLDSHELCGKTSHFTSHRVVWHLLNGFNGSNRRHDSNDPHVEILNLFCSVLGHVLRVLAVCLPGLRKDLLSVSLDKVRLAPQLLETLAHLSLLHDVNVIGFVTLREQFAASDFDDHFQLIVQILQLLVLQYFERRHFTQVSKHSNLAHLLQIVLELLVSDLSHVEEVSVLDGPDRCEALPFPHFDKVAHWSIFIHDTKLTKVRAFIKLSKYDFFWLSIIVIFNL